MPVTRPQVVTALIRAFLSAALLCVALPAAVNAAEIAASDSSSLRLEMHKGHLVRLARPASTVFVADPDIADIHVKSPSLVYVMAKKPGETTLFAVDGNERLLANINLHVEHNLNRLRRLVSELHPDEQIVVNSVDDAVVVDGVVESATVAENVRRVAARFVGEEGEVINRLGVVAPSQVNLRVRVAEMSRDIQKQFGFNWSMVGKIGGFTFNTITANPFNVNVVQDGVNLRFRSGSWDFNTVVDVLEDEGLISILAEPNLTAMSGETASFLAGGEFPILIPEGENRVIIEFKKFGVSLAFTPTIIGKSRINLHVRPEVSQLSNENDVEVPIAGGSIRIPSLVTRRAETTVELQSGESFAIAGLIQNNVTHDIHEFPGLGNVPVLGALFRSDDFQRKESELVILVTPYIVRPSPTRTLATPTDGFAPPHDVQRVLFGGNFRQNTNTGQPSVVGRDGRRLIGPVGFQLD